ncbi:hypothetical protein WMY93_004408 [Mugilogobius chulae]|uniref:F-box domain-containing protein n=1 Tax=Mugilogobius chulae TaxID=88201 RepID=A0AAW0PNI4_9GOBI
MSLKLTQSPGYCRHGRTCPGVSESVVVRSLRGLRERYFPNTSAATAPVDTDQQEPGVLESLPVDLQFQIMTFLSPADLCLLGATCHYWRGMVPQRVSSCRQQWLPSSAPYKVVTSFLQSLVASAEPRYAMFGPGMEQLDVSFVTRLMYAPDVLPVSGSGAPHKQIHGIGSGISYIFNNQHKFNILTLYSTNRAERERARIQNQTINNKLFSVDGSSESGVPAYSPAPHVQQVCQAVDGFIYVANAEQAEGEHESAKIQALLSSTWGSTSRPLLVLSCISRENREVDNQPGVHPITKRVPCVEMAKRLELTGWTTPGWFRM